MNRTTLDVLICFRPHEIFNWLYVIDSNESELWEGGKLVWHVKYQHEESDELEEDLAASNYSKNARLRHRLDVKKDDVQTVLPISKVKIAFRIESCKKNINVSIAYLTKYFLALGDNEHCSINWSASISTTQDLYCERSRKNCRCDPTYFLSYERRLSAEGECLPIFMATNEAQDIGIFIQTGKDQSYSSTCNILLALNKIFLKKYVKF